MFGHVSIKEIAKRWQVSERCIQKVCEETCMKSVVYFAHAWEIPKDTKKSVDRWYKKAGDFVDTNCNM